MRYTWTYKCRTPRNIIHISSSSLPHTHHITPLNQPHHLAQSSHHPDLQPSIMLPLLALLPALAIISATPILKRETARLIGSGRNPGFCLSVQGGRAAVSAGQVTDGTPVITLGCELASLWDVSKGSGSVLIWGTNHALDIGLTPGTGGRVKVSLSEEREWGADADSQVWSSFPLSTQQTWSITDDNRIAQTGGNQCLDQGENGPQTYQCTAGNNNQGGPRSAFHPITSLLRLCS
jgi:hypothetical protein